MFIFPRNSLLPALFILFHFAFAWDPFQFHFRAILLFLAEGCWHWSSGSGGNNKQNLHFHAAHWHWHTSLALRPATPPWDPLEAILTLLPWQFSLHMPRRMHFEYVCITYFAKSSYKGGIFPFITCHTVKNIKKNFDLMSKGFCIISWKWY